MEGRDFWDFRWPGPALKIDTLGVSLGRQLSGISAYEPGRFLIPFITFRGHFGEPTVGDICLRTGPLFAQKPLRWVVVSALTTSPTTASLEFSSLGSCLSPPGASNRLFFCRPRHCHTRTECPHQFIRVLQILAAQCIYSPHWRAELTIPTRCDRYPEWVGVLPEALPQALAELFRIISVSACGPKIWEITQKSIFQQILCSTVRFLGQNVEKPYTFIKFSIFCPVIGMTFGDSGGKM